MQTTIPAMSSEDDLSARARLHQALIEGGHIGEARPVGARRLAGRLNVSIRDVMEAADGLREIGCVRGTPRDGYYIDESWVRSSLVGRQVLLKADMGGPMWTIVAAIPGGIVIERNPPYAAPEVRENTLFEVIVIPTEVRVKLERAAA